MQGPPAALACASRARTPLAVEVQGGSTADGANIVKSMRKLDGLVAEEMAEA